MFLSLGMRKRSKFVWHELWKGRKREGNYSLSCFLNKILRRGLLKLVLGSQNNNENQIHIKTISKKRTIFWKICQVFLLKENQALNFLKLSKKMHI